MEHGSGGRALEIERIIAAPPGRVFAAFTDPDQLAKWWGPQGFVIPSLDFPARAGKGYRIEMQPPEGDSFYLAGELLESRSPGPARLHLRLGGPRSR